MLTTTDNPYSPWTDYDKWYRWDIDNGYNTPSYIARIAEYLEVKLKDLHLNEDELLAAAVAEIVSEDVFGVYIIAGKPEGFVEEE